MILADTARTRCIEIVNNFPKEQLPNLAATLETMYKMLSDAADEAYCLQLYDSSFDPDNDEPQDFIEFAKTLGLEIK